VCVCVFFSFFFFFQPKPASQFGTGDWSSDLCSSHLNKSPIQFYTSPTPPFIQGQNSLIQGPCFIANIFFGWDTSLFRNNSQPDLPDFPPPPPLPPSQMGNKPLVSTGELSYDLNPLDKQSSVGSHTNFHSTWGHKFLHVDFLNCINVYWSDHASHLTCRLNDFEGRMLYTSHAISRFGYIQASFTQTTYDANQI